MDRHTATSRAGSNDGVPSRAHSRARIEQSSRWQRLKLVIGLAALLITASLLGCEGFFVEPVLTGVTVGPAVTIQTGSTVQMSALGTYNDGSQQKLSNVFWSSSTPNIASIDSSGLVTGKETGQTTITGSKDTATGTATITVSVGGLSAIQVSSQDGITSIAYGQTEQFVALGTANGQQMDITDSVTWSTSPSSIPSVTIAPTTGLLTTTSGPATLVQFQVVATDPTTGISGQVTFIVHP